MEFRRLDNGTGDLLVLGHDHKPSEIRTALSDYLESEGMDPWEVDNLAPTVTFSRTWYSPTAGFTHDCSLHEGTVLGCADSEPVIAINYH
jgi:hypothetical protein